jgi:hypothetical protein
MFQRLLIVNIWNLIIKIQIGSRSLLAYGGWYQEAIWTVCDINTYFFFHTHTNYLAQIKYL